MSGARTGGGGTADLSCDLVAVGFRLNRPKNVRVCPRTHIAPRLCIATVSRVRMSAMGATAKVLRIV